MQNLLVPAEDLTHLFDAVPDVVFFIKDCSGCYTHVNLTLVQRLGFQRCDDVIGRRVADLFPVPLGASYSTQDHQVLSGGKHIENCLEVHLFRNRVPGWCLTCKYPLRQRDDIVGIVGISRDLGQPDARHPVYDRLARVVDHLNECYAETVRVRDLARLADLSVAQLERYFQRIFQLSPEQMLTKLRIDAAMNLLTGDAPIASIGQACGYSDQSAFTRQFHKLTGITPGQYRALRR